jgi:hypothetical protein
MNETSPNNTGAGKGDKPRNCFSKKFKDNYDEIDWSAHRNDKSKLKNEELKKVANENNGV